MKGELQSLIAFIKRQQGIVKNIFREIEERIELLDKSKEVLTFISYELHNLYCALVGGQNYGNKTANL